MSYKAFVVDDEPMARSNLSDALTQHQNWQHVCTYSSGRTLKADVLRDKPDVVFLDVQMPGDDGLSLARTLLTLPQPPIIVFVTAFSDYAVTAFELYALDYILKPFDDPRVALCLEKLESVLSNQRSHEKALLAQDAWAKTKPIDKIVIKSSNSLRIIPTEQVFWIGANGNYVDIHHEEGKHLLRGSLKHVFTCLPQKDFIQIHRGYAVRLSLVRELKTINEEKFSISLAGGTELPVGKSFKAALVDALCQNG